jgi:hypothetical protein
MVKFFSHGNVLAKEVFVDKIVENMCQNLSTSFDGKDCDLGEWFTFCEFTPPSRFFKYLISSTGTWDILGMLVLSHPFGYVEHGRDVDGTLGLSRSTID